MAASLDTVAQRALSSQATLQMSYDLAKKCIADGIGNTFIECGVFAGCQSAAMALAAQEAESPRRVLMFDSFVGIPRPSAADDETITGLVGTGDGELETTGISSCSLEAVKAHMEEWGIDDKRLAYMPGWVETTAKDFSSNSPRDVAILRIDVDLYVSTKMCLMSLAPLVVPGGYIIIDDWGVNGALKAFLEYVATARPVFSDIGRYERNGPLWLKVAHEHTC